MLVRHFQMHFSRDIRLMGLQTNIHWDTQERYRCEWGWMHTLMTLEPWALNEKD